MSTALDDVKSSTAQPIRYAEGDWVPYTGPKGGKGWQNTSTGRIVYGPQPGTSQESGFPWENQPAKETQKGSPAEPMQPLGAQPAPTQKPEPKAVEKPPQPAPEKPAAPSPDPKPVTWQSVGHQLWRNPQTGETVKSPEPPGSKTQDIIGKARGQPPVSARTTPQPAAQPGPAEPARPTQTKVHPDMVKAMSKSLDQLPDGTQVMGWTKSTPPTLKTAIWTRGNAALMSNQLVHHHADKLDQFKTELGSKAPNGAQSSPDKSSTSGFRPLSHEEQQTVNSVSSIFGIQPGDIGNADMQHRFIRRTARAIGFNPDSVQGDRTDKTMAAAQFLQSRRAHLESLVSMAQGYGYGGGRAKELAHRARWAGLHLVRTAQSQGFQAQGDSEQEHIAGAVGYLQQQEQRRAQQGQQTRQSISQALQNLRQRFKVGGISLWDIAMAAVGFYVGYRLMRSFRNRRRRYSKEFEDKHPRYEDGEFAPKEEESRWKKPKPGKPSGTDYDTWTIGDLIKRRDELHRDIEQLRRTAEGGVGLTAHTAQANLRTLALEHSKVESAYYYLRDKKQPEKMDKYSIASAVTLEGLDGFNGVLSASQQKKIFGRNVFGKKNIRIDASGQGKVSGSFKVAFGTDFVSFEKSFEEIAKLANDPESIIRF